jgi:hypothetical protein
MKRSKTSSILTILVLCAGCTVLAAGTAESDRTVPVIGFYQDDQIVDSRPMTEEELSHWREMMKTTAEMKVPTKEISAMSTHISAYASEIALLSTDMAMDALSGWDTESYASELEELTQILESETAVIERQAEKLERQGERIELAAGRLEKELKMNSPAEYDTIKIDGESSFIHTH